MSGTESAPQDSGMQPPGSLPAIRLAIGMMQGAALWLLVGPMEPPAWTTSLGVFWTPLTLIAIGIPILLVGGLGQMRLKTLLLWALAASLVLALLGLHDASRIDDGYDARYFERTPSPLLVMFSFPALFIAHHLVAAADADRRIIAGYERYFEIGWTSATQIILAGALVGALWIVLSLGSALFGAIGVTSLPSLVRHPLFAWPATCVTFAMAIQLTETRASLVRGARTLGLALLGWLMPVMTVFVVFFLLALPFTGLGPLWRTGSATPILLASAAAMVALLNAAYQDGGQEKARSGILVVAGLAARVTILPLVALAAVSTWLRIDQYGLSPDRIAAAVATAIALVYAAGYFLSVLPPWRGRPLLERTNIAAAFAGLFAWVAIFSPIADPARISVDDQVARLLDGRTELAKFDFRFLRWDSARYGREALARLSEHQGNDGDGSEAIAKAAKDTLAEIDAYARPPRPPERRITVWPTGKTLPDDFRSATDSASGSAFWRCMVASFDTCDAIISDLDKDGVDEIIIAAISEPYGSAHVDRRVMGEIDVYRLVNGRWSLAGSFRNPCSTEYEAIKRGEAGFAPRQGVDLMVGDTRLALELSPGYGLCR